MRVITFLFSFPFVLLLLLFFLFILVFSVLVGSSVRVSVCVACSPNMKKIKKIYKILVIRRNTARLWTVFAHVIIIAMICLLVPPPPLPYPLSSSSSSSFHSVCVSCKYSAGSLVFSNFFNFIVIHCQWGLAVEIPIAHCPGVKCVMNLCACCVCVCAYYSTHLYVYFFVFFF